MSHLWNVRSVRDRWTSRSARRRKKARAGRTRAGRANRLEALEDRLALDGRVIISEIVASNDQGLEDEDGDASDWIELYNEGDQAVDLNGWYLTDDMQNLRTWSFPSRVLRPNEYLVVFASSKNRADPTGNLHTNFRLRAQGEDLALIEPNGTTVADAYLPFPGLDADRSFGLPQSLEAQAAISAGADLRTQVPSESNGGASAGLDWVSPSYDDSGWAPGTNGVGYELQTGFEQFIGTDVSAEMLNVNSSVYVRMPFQLEQAASVFSLTLRMRYDDGYIAYLNGVQVADRNAPDEPAWNSNATASHVDRLAVEFEDVDVTAFIPHLRSGENVLAIHGLNSSSNSNDFLIAPELIVGQPGPLLGGDGRHFAMPTPSAPNGEISYANWISRPSVNVARGVFDAPFDLVVASQTPGSTLVYTIDGSQPSLENGFQIVAANGQLAPILSQAMTQTTTMRVSVFKEDYLPSRTETRTWIFPDDVIFQDESFTLGAGFPNVWRTVVPDYGLDPDVIGLQDVFGGVYRDQFVESLTSIPTMSIVMDVDDLFGDEGIYSFPLNSGREWERPTSVEIVSPDGATDFQIDAGIRIAGGASRQHDSTKKKSFRLVFRREYGASKMEFPIFGESGTDRFDTLVLRDNYNDGWQWSGSEDRAQYLRDEWTRATQLAMGQAGSHGTFMHLYINGIYWGLYNPVERPDANFTSTYLGGEDDEWDALNTGVAVDGSDAAWHDLLDLAAQVAVPDAAASYAAYQQLQGRRPDGSRDPNIEPLLDVDNLIDYMILNFYIGNTDWPTRNWYAGRQRGPDSEGFQFFAWDNEWVLNLRSTLTTDRTGVDQGVAQPYGHLRSNAEFRLRFADHVQKHFSPGGALYVDLLQPTWDAERPASNVPAARYHQRADAIAMAMVAESARWGDQHFQPAYTPADWQQEVDALLSDYFPNRSEIVLSQFRQAGLYSDVAVPTVTPLGGPVQGGSQVVLNAPGTVYYTLDGSDPRVGSDGDIDSANQVSPSARLYTGPIALNESILLKTRTWVDGNWSALQETTFTVTDPSLRVTEIMYHPPGPSAAEVDAGFSDDDDFEFIELQNVSDSELQLSGIRFTKGIEFDFSHSQIESISPGDVVVLARNQAALAARYGELPNVVGEYGGTLDDLRLSNGGETLRLIDASGAVIQEFAYDDSWYPQTDGVGSSLQIIGAYDPDVSRWGVANAWQPSRQIGGTPGIASAGDVNEDGNVDESDIHALCAAIRVDDPRFDLTYDGHTDRSDLSVLIQFSFGTHFGDANLDRVFDSTDLIDVLQAGEYEDQIVGNSTWSEGDWDCDGDFDSSDLVFALQFAAYEG